MGHERVGLLPKTQRWRDIVEGIATVGVGGLDVAGIVRQTTDNIRDRLDGLERDQSLLAAFKFLVSLPVASRSGTPVEVLGGLGIAVPADPSPIALAKALQRFMPERPDSVEYARIAQSAAVDAVAEWSARAEGPKDNLFGTASQPFDVWRQAADGAGFCELSRIFFGRFTQRYLNYFLEREASAVLPTAGQRDRFSEELGQHVDEVSRHAFETAKITQSFAAGWFNKHAKEGLPSDASMRGFLRLALGKLSEELRREGQR
jgi:hypothetical protein